MDINNKDIWRESKKYCIICERESENSGIEIMNSFICEECLQKMNLIDTNSREYDNVKNKIKKAIVSRILNLKS